MNEKTLSVICACSFAFILGFGVNPPATFADTTGILLHKSNLTYLGGFRLPGGSYGDTNHSDGFSYVNRGVAFNASGNSGAGSLFIQGHQDAQLVAEIAIPIPKNTIVSSMNVASVLQSTSSTNGLYDILEGQRNYVCTGSHVVDGVIRNGSAYNNNDSICDPNPKYIGGLLVYGNKLLGTVYNFYDGNNTAVFSHFKSGLSLASTGDFEGLYRVQPTGLTGNKAGFVAGYMAPIPAAYQSALGGPVLTGMGGLSIAGRTSQGPAAFSFNPDNLGSGTLGSESNPVTANPLLYYTLDHKMTGVNWNTSFHVVGLTFPEGSRSVLFWGRAGTGVACYGPGTPNLSEAKSNDELKAMFAGKPDMTYTCNGNVMRYGEVYVAAGGAGDGCCYDPIDIDKGPHSYPYHLTVWAYDAEDLVKVKNGTVNPSTGLPYKPWEVLPYEIWDLADIYPSPSSILSISGVAYDTATQKLYVVNKGGDTWGKPIIHVFKIQMNVPAIPKNVTGTIAK